MDYLQMSYEWLSTAPVFVQVAAGVLAALLPVCAIWLRLYVLQQRRFGSLLGQIGNMNRIVSRLDHRSYMGGHGDFFEHVAILRESAAELQFTVDQIAQEKGL